MVVYEWLKVLKELQHEKGLFSASKQSVNTGYDRAWIRDNIYEALGLEAMGRHEDVTKVYHALLDILLKHEDKIDWAIKNKPTHTYQYIHARYDIEDFNEIWEEWGNKQNDAIGAFLFKVGDLEKKGIKIIRDDSDLRILQKVVDYLKSVEYWQDPDNGMWEEAEEVHASSIGACVAGLKAVSNLVKVPEELIKNGQDALNKLLPNESITKDADLALLSLIYPYNVVSDEQRDLILKNVEEKLVREKGVIRYVGDKYYYKNGCAEWVFGFPWMAIIYKNTGNTEKYMHYIKKTISCMNEKGELPELYFSKTEEHNENSPLGWTQSLGIVALMT